MTPVERFEIALHDVAMTAQLAHALAAHVRGGDILALDGALGSGKTTLVRHLVAALGGNEKDVSSPTFTICQEYALASAADRPNALIHIDAYRLGSSDELEDIGFDEMCARDDAVICIEWASRIEDQPPTWWHLGLEHVADQSVASSSRSAAIELPRERAWEGGTATVPCPVCSAAVSPIQHERPFCSQRCRMADLHGWLGGHYRISRPVQSEDFES